MDIPRFCDVFQIRAERRLGEGDGAFEGDANRRCATRRRHVRHHCSGGERSMWAVRFACTPESFRRDTRPTAAAAICIYSSSIYLQQQHYVSTPAAVCIYGSIMYLQQQYVSTAAALYIQQQHYVSTAAAAVCIYSSSIIYLQQHYVSTAAALYIYSSSIMYLQYPE